MPEYLAPGVYVEETSFRSKTIEGVSTSTAGFVGAARFGPTEGEPELLTSFTDFERIYGGLDQLDHGGVLYHNYLAHAVRAFFEEGGKRLYVARAASSDAAIATATVSADGDNVTLRARYPGRAGNLLVTFLFRIGPNILDNEGGVTVLRGAQNYDLVWIRGQFISPPGGDLFWLERFRDPVSDRYNFRLRQNDPTGSSINAHSASDLRPVGDETRLVTVNVTVSTSNERTRELVPLQTWENLTFHPQHPSSLSRVFEAKPDRLLRRTLLYVPLVFDEQLNNGVQIAKVLLSQQSRRVGSTPPTLLEALTETDEEIPENERSFQIQLGVGTGNTAGTDGSRPRAAEFAGQEYRRVVTFDHPVKGAKSGLLAFEDLEDISIVAAPGTSFDYANYKNDADTILRQLIAHCERMKYRIAVLDSANGHLVSEVRDFRGKLDSKYAALYYPWVCVLDPVTEKEIKLPPSGFVAGIYARNDIEFGVHKAPANEVVRMAIGFEMLLNKAQQDVLNPEGVNCFRFFEGRGYRLWGARTITSDPEWKYVNLRRYFAYLERSIDKGTQWAVFENNNTPLWNNIHQTVYDFLYNEWKNDWLMGETPKEAFFVRCDRSTMTQNDIDNGRLVCLIGVAPVRPAEFVIFRIGQWTADRRA